MKKKIIIDVNHKDLWRLHAGSERHAMEVESLMVLGGLRLLRDLDSKSGGYVDKKKALRRNYIEHAPVAHVEVDDFPLNMTIDALPGGGAVICCTPKDNYFNGVEFDHLSSSLIDRLAEIGVIPLPRALISILPDGYSESDFAKAAGNVHKAIQMLTDEIRSVLETPRSPALLKIA